MTRSPAWCLLLLLVAVGACGAPVPVTTVVAPTVFDAPRRVVILSDPPGALVVMNQRDTLGAAPGTANVRRGRRDGVADPVLLEAFTSDSAACAQATLVAPSAALPDTVRFDMRRCPDPRLDYGRAFSIAEVAIEPQWVGVRSSTTARLVNGRAVVVCVIDTLGHVEPNTVRVVDSTGADAARKARETVRNMLWWPGRILDRKVRTIIQIPLNFSHGP